MFRYKSKYKKIGVLPIWIVKFNVSISVGPSSERNKNIFETLDVSIGSTPTFLYIVVALNV